ncbi:MAG: glucose 1-dehydrogenase [Nitrospirae bacterium]|nr:glucose 1-dehydrogenase [Nitrospirota bacterium]
MDAGGRCITTGQSTIPDCSPAINQRFKEVNMRLKGKVAIVTGGGTGIGEAIATRFAKEGAKVVITGRRKDVLNKVVDSINHSGGLAFAIPGSVTVEADVQYAVNKTYKQFGRVDILVNNAGNLFHAGPFHETTDAVWDETLDVFLKGVFRFTRAVIPQMLKQGSGSIVNISTVAALKALPGFPAHAYAAAKAGVNMLTKTVAIQYAKDGIRCNAICPGAVDTPGVAAWTGDPQAREWFDSIHPLGRIGRPEEIAQAALYLASEDSVWTTGSILPVDGGIMAQ